MFEQSYFQLLTPLISLTFSGGFLLLWRTARDISSLRFFAVSYFAASCAMIVDFLQSAFYPGVASAVLSTLYLATTVFFCAGLHARYRNRVPWKTLTISAAAVMVCYAALRYGLSNVVPSAWAINTGLALIYLHAIHALRHEMRDGIHRILQTVIVASVVLLLLRTGVIFWFVGATMADTDYAGSLASVTLQMLLAVVSLAVAGALFTMYGTEILRRLTESSETDPLTGTLNRRGFEARIDSFVRDGQAGGSSRAVVMADIDWFKAVNDRYGHEAGDLVISAFARLLCDAAREGDFVVRWGGEEFLVILSHADAAAARLFAEGVRTRWEAFAHDCLGGRTVTASFGVAACENNRDVRVIGRRADVALYRAKREGRNRVCVDGLDPAGQASAVA
ncbi:GGDEF domain-containing protein [Oricola indica]|jgi:diguanylate cyclase (GGDEF)-like protein|uniref:GGDEF domain-containing protein n=1 Tax=Oricola indica TaxID=2872591 RepID=UPI001CBED736|nr:GGDEF domain-containing protein [Oricola indica]